MRIFGLDIIRSSAILLVLFGHLGNVGLMENSYALYLSGFYGVELFFVLSGFLIGQIFFREFDGPLSFKNLKTFWYRRWLRTLPLYYLVLLIRILFTGSEFPTLHFLFLQNSDLFSGYNNEWFGESWSLCIEEYFYLLFPILILLLHWITKKINLAILFSIVITITLCFILRYHYAFSGNWIDYDTISRKTTYFRLDAIAYGVLIAWTKFQLPVFFGLLQNKIIPIVAIASIVLVHVLLPNTLVYNFYDLKHIPSTYGFSLNSLLLSTLIPYFSGFNPNVSGLKLFISLRWIVTQIALYSYCIYLIHLPIYHLFIKSEVLSISWYLEIMLSFFVIILLSAISYNYFEKPILAFRQKFA